MKSPAGRIRKKRGWKVNPIYFDPEKDKTITWTCPPTRRFWAFLPTGKFPSPKRIALVKSTKGKASYRMPGMGLKKGDRLYYCLLLDDGKRIQLVRGSSPPVIIIK
jgi:hypothetical protein